MDVELTHYHHCHFDSLVRLLDDAFQIRNPAKADLVRWKFFDAIHDDCTVMALAVAGGEVVSQYANAPVTLADDGAPVPAMVCADMATAPQYRGRGLISRLSRMVYTEVTASGAVLSIGYSNDDGVQVDRNATGYGYLVVGRFTRYLRPVLRRLATPCHLEPVSAFDASALPCLPGLRLHKSAEYLTWRYLRKPHMDYVVYRVMRGAETLGYAVLRDARGRCHLVDLIADPSRDVLRAVHNEALRRGKRALMVYVLDNAYWRGVLRGFVRLPQYRRLGNYWLTVKPHQQTLPVGWDTPDKWLLMGGDII